MVVIYFLTQDKRKKRSARVVWPYHLLVRTALGQLVSSTPAWVFRSKAKATAGARRTALRPASKQAAKATRAGVIGGASREKKTTPSGAEAGLRGRS